MDHFRKRIPGGRGFCIPAEIYGFTGQKAVFYGTALGVYEAELNGTKIGSQMFAPGFSYYPRRVLYQTHEVTELLREGENTLTVYLGQGWYCGRFLCENQTQIYGEQPAVAWILELEDAAGSRKIVSDETVEELESPYEYAGEYDEVDLFCRRKRERDRSCGRLHKGDAVRTGADTYGGAPAG